MQAEDTFESIAAAGRAIVDAHKKKKGFEDGIRRLLSELYPDNAHFIYELLQNAEDAHASVVEFDLRASHLEVRHTGSRQFTLSDIDSITNIGDSTKKDDPTQIGKFGVGFKAVYSYTSRPEIMSGPYSFAIEDLFVNAQTDGHAPDGLTVFRFPFDRDEKPSAIASEEVANALAELDEKTLLFLNYIATITYTLPDGRIGIIERLALDDQIVKIQKSEGEDFIESHWLRLVGQTHIESIEQSTHSVAAAFRLECLEQIRTTRNKEIAPLDKSTMWSIVPLDHGDVSIYFPAVKEKSGLRFHIHAPFASTVARDSVRDDPDNVKLIQDIGVLIANALPALRDQGLIDDGFLTALPNQEDPVGYPYNYIRDSIRNAFNQLAITPARGSGYAPATSLVSSPSEFRNLLAEADLPALLATSGLTVEGTPRWIRDRDGRAGRFLGGLETIQFGWSELESALINAEDVGDPEDAYVAVWLQWLESKNDETLLNFYQLVGRGYNSNQLDESLESIPMVRLVRRGKTQHVMGPDTYLPSSRTDKAQIRVPVNLSYFDDDEDRPRGTNLKAFYDAAGVRRWNEAARIEARLDFYRTPNRPAAEEVDFDKHLNDVRAFAEYALSNSQSARRLFQNVPFLLAPRPDGSTVWISPVESYLDIPYKSTGLSALYPWISYKSFHIGQPDFYRKPHPVASFYLEVHRFEDFLTLIGCRVGIEISKCDVYKNELLEPAWWVDKRRTLYTETLDWKIEALDKIIATGDHNLLRTLWRTVITAKTEKAHAIYRANASFARHKFASQLVQELKSKAWVLDRNGELRKPRELTFDELPEDWEHPPSDSLVHELNFGTVAFLRRSKIERAKAFLREEGLDDDGIEFLREAKEAGMTVSELRSVVRDQSASRRFPESPSLDPTRRSSAAEQDALTAPTHRSESRVRSIVEGQNQVAAESKDYLRGQYTTDEGQMYCQACQKPLPFRIAGLWYFESVRFVNARQQLHTANALALCPLCAALYKYARGTENKTLLADLDSVEIGEGKGKIEIHVVLDGKLVPLGFTGKHAIDLQATLRAAGGERA